jgi:hypothetical protein
LIFEDLKAAQRKTCPFRMVPVLRDEFRRLPDTTPCGFGRRLSSKSKYRQRLEDRLRHAALKGIRPDKKPG